MSNIYKSNSKLYKKVLIKFDFLLHLQISSIPPRRHKISIYQEKLLPPQQTMTNFLYHKKNFQFIHMNKFI